MPGFECIGKEEQQALNDVFEKSGGVLYRYGLNDRRKNIFRVDDFEKAIAKRVGTQHAHCVCNGTAALKIGLFALGVKPGDEVITQSFTFIATVEAILELSAIPVITEIDETLTMDPSDLEKKITSKTRVIIPVHMAGVSARMDEIMDIAKKHSIPIFEDSAQALGAMYKEKQLGTLGTAGIYSFDIGKVITTGEGGALVTNSQEMYQKAREYSDHGHECNPNVPRGKDTRTIWGFNYKMMELQGAVGLAQLQKLDAILEKQRAHKHALKEALTDTLPNLKFRELPDEKGDAGDTLIFFLESRKKAHSVAQHLKENGIGTKNLPDAVNWHFAGTWNHIFSDTSQWPQSENLLRRAIALPIMVEMDNKRIEFIAEKVKEAIEK